MRTGSGLSRRDGQRGRKSYELEVSEPTVISLGCRTYGPWWKKMFLGGTAVSRRQVDRPVRIYGKGLTVQLPEQGRRKFWPSLREAKHIRLGDRQHEPSRWKKRDMSLRNSQR